MSVKLSAEEESESTCISSVGGCSGNGKGPSNAKAPAVGG